MEDRRPQADAVDLRFSVDENPPHPLAAMLGLQTVLLIVAGIVITPLIVLRAAEAGAAAMEWAVFAALLVSGLTTMLQARPIGPIGAGYVLFMGTSGAFIAVSTTAVREGGLPLLATLVAFSALAQFMFAARLSWLRTFITPTVGGTVVMLIAVTVFPICFRMLTSVPPNIDPVSPAGPVTAAITFVVVLGISLFTAGRLRLWGPLIGVVIGTAVAAMFGMTDFSAAREAAWVGVPTVAWPGMDLSFDARLWGLLPAFLIVTLVGAVETYGDGIAIQRVSHRQRKPLDFRAIQGAVSADGFGNLLSGLAGTLPNTTYSTSISVTEITGVAARRVGVYGGGLLVAIAFLPKFSAVLRAVPDAVAGAYILILLVLLFAHGIRLATENGLNYEDGFVVCLSFWVGVGFQNQLIFQDHLAGWAQTLLNNGMTSGGITAMVLTLMLSWKNRSPNKQQLTLEAASVPKMHEFLGRVATRAGWDKAAITRLQLASEEALLFLIRVQGVESDEGEELGEDSDLKDVGEFAEDSRTVVLAVKDQEHDLWLEFAAGPDHHNLEGLMANLPAPDTNSPSAPRAGLRILSHLAEDLRHEQFSDRTFLAFRVESRAL